MDWCQSCVWWAAYWVWTGTGFTSNCTGFALNLHLRDIAWQPHWLWYDNGMTLDWTRIGTEFILIWRACDEDWHRIDLVLIQDCQKIDTGLAHDLDRISTLLTPRWLRICAVLENIQYYWWVNMWDVCGTFISYDVGCMWDFKESENIQIKDSLL